MPTIARRKPVGAPSGQSISAFTRVSKGPAFLDNASVKKVKETSSRKRKAPVDDDDRLVTLDRRTVSFPPSSDEDVISVKRACRREEPRPQPRTTIRPAPVVAKGKRTAKAVPSKTESAHKPGASTILGQSKQQGKTIQTKLDSYHKKIQNAKNGPAGDDLPPHLADLVRLHKAFLRTVMIQFAHNGSTAPLDIDAISPHVSRSWGKRKVTVEDIRRCVAIQSTGNQDASSPFIVTDYGRGKVCVELKAEHDGTAVNQEQLCQQFRENLMGLGARRATDEMSDVHISLESLSLADLPQAAITNMDNGIKAHPQLNKGHHALSELRDGIVANQQEKEANQQISTANQPLNPDGSKMSLLDRLRLKQLAKADGPLPPSGPELERRAALNRVMDVTATVSMLSLANPMSLPRQAFAMSAILEKLRDSLRVPTSKEEGAACLKLIASEVAPEWLRIVTVGGRQNVVVQRGGQPVDRIIQERVQKLLA